jgi:hypothetical protein
MDFDSRTWQETYKEFRPLDPFNEIIVSTLHLNMIGGLKREDTNLLVCYLARDSLVDETDENIFCGHEWEFLHKLRMNDGWKDDQAICNVIEAIEDGISQEEHFGDVHSTDCAIVKTALQPLLRKRFGEVGRNVAEFSPETTNSFRATNVFHVSYFRELIGRTKFSTT